jgi:hypothetical protein
MQSKRKYFVILVLGFLLWIGETATFGFNAKPQSGLEAMLDTVSAAMMIYGIIGDLLTNVEIHKNYYKYKETHIHTKNVEIKGDNPNVHNNYSFGTTKDETRELLAKHPKKQ